MAKHMKTFLQKFFELAGAVLVATAASAQDFSIDQFNFVSGTGTSTGSIFALSGIIGQPEAVLMSSGNFSLTGEFLSHISSIPPADAATTIFDNSDGSFNGFQQ